MSDDMCDTIAPVLRSFLAELDNRSECLKMVGTKEDRTFMPPFMAVLKYWFSNVVIVMRATKNPNE